MADKHSTTIVLAPYEGKCDVTTPACFRVKHKDTAVWEVTSYCPDARVVELVFRNPKPVQGNLTSQRPKGGKRWPDIEGTVMGAPGTRHKYDVHVDGKMVLDPDLEIDP